MQKLLLIFRFYNFGIGAGYKYFNAKVDLKRSLWKVLADI